MLFPGLKTLQQQHISSSTYLGVFFSFASPGYKKTCIIHPIAAQQEIIVQRAQNAHHFPKRGLLWCRAETPDWESREEEKVCVEKRERAVVKGFTLLCFPGRCPL